MKRLKIFIFLQILFLFFSCNVDWQGNLIKDLDSKLQNTVSFYLENGSESDILLYRNYLIGSIITEQDFPKFGDLDLAEIKPGYDVTDWKKDGSQIQNIIVPDIPTQVSISGQLKPRTDTPYTLICYIENLEKDSSFEFSATPEYFYGKGTTDTILTTLDHICNFPNINLYSVIYNNFDTTSSPYAYEDFHIKITGDGLAEQEVYLLRKTVSIDYYDKNGSLRYLNDYKCGQPLSILKNDLPHTDDMKLDNKHFCGWCITSENDLKVLDVSSLDDVNDKLINLDDNTKIIESAFLLIPVYVANNYITNINPFDGNLEFKIKNTETSLTQNSDSDIVYEVQLELKYNQISLINSLYKDLSLYLATSSTAFSDPNFTKIAEAEITYGGMKVNSSSSTPDNFTFKKEWPKGTYVINVTILYAGVPLTASKTIELK